MIAVSSLAKAFGSQTLFEGVSVQLNPGCRYGLVGANGSGKTTLLRILAGEEPASEGSVSISKRLQIGVLQQDHFRYEDVPILHVAMMGHRELWRAMEEKEEVLARAEEHFDADRYSQLEDTILRHDGYSLEAHAGEILEGLGIPTELHKRPLRTLSGGFKLRCLLAQTLASRPDALLLDEPTNHLDIVSIRWLEKFLVEFPGVVVLISHDHRFLDNVCTHILDVDYQTVSLYHGNYTAFAVAKVEERKRREAEIARREKEIADHQAFVDRFRAKATKARQAQSRVKLIDKLASELEPLPPSSRRYPTFKLKARRASGKEALRLEGISKAYGDNIVLDGIDLSLRRGDRLAIIGPNGIGKSTLLKIAVGVVEAEAGAVEWGYEAHPGYFAQDHREQLGDSDKTVERWLWDVCPSEPIGFVRGKLGEVLFSGDEAKKKIRHLSGGEAARLVLARLSVEKPNVLVLDEPTNHLDLEAIEALVEGLLAYDGTLIFVSHDRWVVSRLATRILEISHEGLNDFPGTWEEYLESCGDDHLDADQVVLRERRDRQREKARRTAARGGAGGDRKRVRRLEERRDEVTARIEAAEARVREIDESFCDPGFFDRTAPERVRELEREQTELRAEADRLLAEWEELERRLERVEA